MNAAASSQPIPSGARRTENRATARVSVTVRTLRETTNGLVLDVSRSGARLFMDGAIDCGGDVLLHWLGHDVCAKVAWSRQYECGVEFTRPLEDDALARISAALGQPTAKPVVEDAEVADRDPGHREAPKAAMLTVKSIKRRPIP